MSISEVKLPHARNYVHELYLKPKIGTYGFYVVGAAWKVLLDSLTRDVMCNILLNVVVQGSLDMKV